MERNKIRCIELLVWLWFILATEGLCQQGGTKIWEFRADGRISSSPALGADGTIYFGGGTNLYALNSTDGSLKWRFAARGLIYSSPAIGLDGTLYFGAFDQRLYAVSPAGKKKWTFDTGGWIYSSPAIDTDGTIYFGSDDTLLYALNADGTRKWSFATSGFVRCSPAIGADGTIYVGSWDNQLYALNRKGVQLWAFEASHYVYSSPAIGVDGTIYVGSVDNKLYALHPDGTRKWAMATGSHIYASPALATDGTLYIGSWDNKLYSVNPAGNTNWTFATGSLVQSSPAIDTNGIIFFGSDEKKLYALNPDGSKRWAFTTSSLVRSSPVISPDGTVYVGSEDGRFYALRSGLTNGLAISPWPMFRGNARHRAKVQLVLTQQPQSQEIIVAKPVSFEVKASGAGPLFYQWQHQGTNLPNATQPALSIPAVQSIHSGQYAVVVSNSLETLVSTPATLTVVVPPIITAQPQNQTIAIDSRAAFTVTATSVAPLTYQWYCQGTNLPGEISPMLVFPEVQPSRAGNYHVVISNSAGSVTSVVATLTVVVPPEIIIPPQNQVGAVGTAITFAVAVRSVVPVQYQWRFNGTNLPNVSTTNLVLNNIQPANAGNYSVVVSNIAGSVTSPSALLTVTLPPLITGQPKDQTAIAGRTATFSVTASSAGPLTYQWRFRGTNLPSGTTSTLSLNPLSPQQAGTYSVIVSNVAGSVTSAPVQLTILIPPGIDRQPLSQTGSVGGTITFHVSAHGSPPLDYFWQYQGTNLPGATNPILTLSRLTANQVGEYRVLITNLAGSTTSPPVTVSVLPPRSLWERIKGWF